jgi:hypothetical protein
MILCEFTPAGGSLTRIALVDIALTYQWRSHINSMSSVKFQTSRDYGGYAKPVFSDITLSPDLFDGAWPPVKTADVKLIITETNEAAGVTLFEGTAQRREYDRTGIKYILKHPEFTDIFDAAASYSGTLTAAILDLATTRLGLTIDATGTSRTDGITVSFTAAKDAQSIDVLDDLCAFYTHAFTIEGTTLYLYDLLLAVTVTSVPLIDGAGEYLLDNVTDMLEDVTDTGVIALTEFDVMPSSYKDGNPISLITSGVYSVVGSDLNGDEVSISTSYAGVNTEAALTNILTVLESQIAVIKAKVDDSQPKILDHLTLIDDSTINTTTTAARAMSVVYNFDTLDMEIEAWGTVT